MADSNAEETKTERLHMLISPSELKAIDDWGYSRRIRTKAESVRRLCQIGMAAESQIHNAQKRTERALKALFATYEKSENVNSFPEPLRTGLAAAITEMTEAHRQLVAWKIAETIMSDSERKDIDQLTAAAKTYIDALLAPGKEAK